MKRPIIIGGAVALLAATPAMAHTGHAEVSGFAAGFAHPFLGLDHLIAMVAIGVWAVQYGARQAVALPGGFVGGMLAGCGIAFAGIAIPEVEGAIALSVLALGLLLTLQARTPLAVAATLALIAGTLHGNAHGLEASGAASAYMTGFVVSTALLHAGGVALGLALSRIRFAAPVAGGLAAAAGLMLIAG
jgi:urease accessory protein